MLYSWRCWSPLSNIVYLLKSSSDKQISVKLQKYSICARQSNLSTKVVCISISFPEPAILEKEREALG
jgi:hypothetical protein